MKNLRAPTNESKTNPALLLADAMMRGGSQSILDMEARGQQELAQSDTLPVEVNHKTGTEATALLAALGIKVLGPVPGDALFQYVELPEGWKVNPTDHSMWSELVDDKGRSRAGIFYKAAFYDRGAHMGLGRRYSCGRDYKIETEVVYQVRDGKAVIAEFRCPVNPDKSWDHGTAKDEALAYLKKNFPDYERHDAYWD